MCYRTVLKPGPKKRNHRYCFLLPLHTVHKLKKTIAQCKEQLPKNAKTSKTRPISAPSRPTSELCALSLGSTLRRGHRATTAVSGRRPRPSTRQMMETWC